MIPLSSPDATKRIAEATDAIVDRLVKLYRPRSIILTGSFGRDEVTTRVRDGSLEFLSDCDVTVISQKYVPHTKVNELAREVREEFGLDLSVSGVKLSLFLLIPGLSRNLRPTIQNFDLKHGSKVIYGKDYLREVPDFDPGEIPFWEGMRVVFNHMAATLKTSPLQSESCPQSAYESCKLALACRDAVMLSDHKYDSSYRSRNLMFQQSFPEEFRLAAPEFPSLVADATAFKLTGSLSREKTKGMYFAVSRVCDQVVRWGMSKELGVVVRDWVDISRYYTQSMSIKGKGKALQQNVYKLAEMLLTNRRDISLKLLSKIAIPWPRVVYSVIPLIYFAPNARSELNLTYLREARRVISLLKRLEKQKPDTAQEYEYLRTEVLALWYSICY
jgi:hypothetical protein